VQSFLALLVRFNGIILFILLEGIAIYIMTDERRNKDHSQVFFSTSNVVIGSFTEKINAVKRYWNLKGINDSLVQENSRLYTMLRQAEIQNSLLANTDTSKIAINQLKDSLKSKGIGYTFVEAEIIDNSTTKLNNYITINKGYNSGIHAGLGVISITGQGVIGIVRKVTKNYAVIMSILHQDINVSAKIKRNNYFGLIKWDGKYENTLSLTSIPKHAEVKRGDTIVTSGFSGMFPAGIMIGTVDTFHLGSGSNFYNIDVKPVTNISSLQQALIVHNLVKPELDSLNIATKQLESNNKK
jgi:rod shape-determining protein MreC